MGECSVTDTWPVLVPHPAICQPDMAMWSLCISQLWQGMGSFKVLASGCEVPNEGGEARAKRDSCPLTVPWLRFAKSRQIYVFVVFNTP